MYSRDWLMMLWPGLMCFLYGNVVASPVSPACPDLVIIRESSGREEGRLCLSSVLPWDSEVDRFSVWPGTAGTKVEQKPMTLICSSSRGVRSETEPLLGDRSGVRRLIFLGSQPGFRIKISWLPLCCPLWWGRSKNSCQNRNQILMTAMAVQDCGAKLETNPQSSREAAGKYKSVFYHPTLPYNTTIQHNHPTLNTTKTRLFTVSCKESSR